MKSNCATEEGTARYAERFASQVSTGHFRRQQNLMMSSIGIGTYLGHWDAATDRLYEESVRRAVELGCNVIDSAINYRFQRSERNIGAALKQLFATGAASRDEIILATKGGYVPFDGEMPRDPHAWIKENIIDAGAARPEDIIDTHCMSPDYLDDQLSRSLANLGLECIDIYYIHNPETQLDRLAREEFLRRIRAAFEFLETAAAAGRIKFYGTATWNGYRQTPLARGYLSLAELEKIARELAGADHRFRVVQLPYNLAMPEAFVSSNQLIDGEYVSLIEAAERLHIAVMSSASILQSRLASNLPDFIRRSLDGLATDAQRAIQFVRSTTGVTTALVGMSHTAHVEENMMTARVAPLSGEDFRRMIESAG
jgi:aryl-alcohol dehydrogenase-like predicted oxidoreductase